MNLIKKVGTGVALAVSSVAAMAQTAPTVDTTAISGAGTQIALVGAAVFAVYVGIKLYKWIKSAL
ncbi:major capsid protein [Collimonas sp.]|jgi:hypothetical protein|uniref:major capsid protein n=1 Tax=Collimonas sp. TaxID=1963772 RepID=UPI002C1C2F81|nr:major capsid protein [Collimonas sp.]HWW06326.1 major capsid protein [Collimonas sp.]